MPFEVRIHPSVGKALRGLRFMPDFEQLVRQRIIEDLHNAPELYGHREIVPVPYVKYPLYVADPDPYSTVIHRFLLYVNEPGAGVRNLLSFSTR